MKKLFLIFLILTLSNCGYTPLYTNIEEQDLKLTITNLSGDKNFNNLLKMQLIEYLNNDSNNEYKVSINSTYSKQDYAKDATGKASEFQLNLDVEFSVGYKGKNRSFLLSERFNTNASDDKFKQKNYEETILKNFASSIKDQLVLRLLAIK
tara:strand:- start:34 stop:486 length:453 start_codon:yes stop_codon:yes gene_type:complete